MTDETSSQMEARNKELQKALTTLVAIERDRQLGYVSDELHMDPRDALQEALDALEANDVTETLRETQPGETNE